MMSHSVVNSRIVSPRVASVADVAYADAYADADANNGVRKSKTTPTPSISKEGRRLSNHLAAPWAAGVVGAFRQVFGGDVTVIHVHEGEVNIGKPTELTDVEIISIPGKMKGKKRLPAVQFTIGRLAA